MDSFQQKKATKDLMSMAESGLNSRFSDMFKAFQYIDLDRSGRISRDELMRALKLWNSTQALCMHRAYMGHPHPRTPILAT